VLSEHLTSLLFRRVLQVCRDKMISLNVAIALWWLSSCVQMWTNAQRRTNAVERRVYVSTLPAHTTVNVTTDLLATMTSSLAPVYSCFNSL